MIPGISRWELLEIQKPARYLGGEWNQSSPKPAAELRFCVAFPDVYEIGMSNLALKILYELLDKDPRIAVERVFSPWVDFEALLRKKKLPLFALESKSPVRDFDVLGITLPYEMTFTNVLNLLDLSGISLLRQERSSGPLIIGGGPSASNPAVMADFFDAILVGDGEEAVLELAETIIRGKGKGWSRLDQLKAIAGIEGYFVPLFPEPVKRRVFKGFSASQPPLKPVVPFVESVHDRVTMEIFRGCLQGCRFCNAGYFYRPKRERNPENLRRWAHEMLMNTGDESLGLISLSTSDYGCLDTLIDGLEADKVFPEQTLSVPSLRMDDRTLAMLKRASSIKKSGLTFAPEAGSQRLRDIIQKRITEEDILKVIEGTQDPAFRSVKLYFMIGLPFETMADVESIVDLVDKMGRMARKTGLRKEISVSLSGFVPKAHTPFQWSPQLTIEELRERRSVVQKGLRRLGVKVSWRDEGLCQLEGVLSRGDERVGKVILAAFRKGCRFDGWSEHHRPQSWNEAFAEFGLDPREFIRERSLSESLPWDFIDYRVPRAFLEAEFLKARGIAQP